MRHTQKIEKIVKKINSLIGELSGFTVYINSENVREKKREAKKICDNYNLTDIQTHKVFMIVGLIDNHSK